MLKEVISEIRASKGGPRGRSPKLKELDVPLTDSEIKKLKSLQDKAKKKGGVDHLIPPERELLKNLIDREKVPQKEFELKTMSQIKKSRNLTSTLKAFVYLANDDFYAKNYLKYAEKNEKLKDSDFEAFKEEYRDKAKKIVKSKAFKDLAINNLRENIEADSYNDNIPGAIKNWVISILVKEGIESLVTYDGYKLFQDIEIEESTDSWVSRQGASMTSKKAKVKFTSNVKTYEEEFDLGTSGYWNN